MAGDDTQVPQRIPETLDRGAMERVLARAAELASQSSSDTPDMITEAQLLEIGKEVGLSPTTIQQALAEERTRVVLVEESGLTARMMGPGMVSATRVIAHPPEAVVAAVEAWMANEYRFTPKRRTGNRRTWEPRSGALGKLERELRSNRSVKALARATEVSLTVSAVGDGRTVVRFDADLSEQRRARRTSGIAFGIAGVLVGAAPVIIGSVLAPLTMLPLFIAFGAVPLIGFGAGGVAMMRGQREQAERSQTALEQLLDRLEHEALPRAALPGSSAPLLTDTLNAVALGVREVARAVQDAAAAKRGVR